MPVLIRAARTSEFQLLQEIEHDSDALFASVGMPEIYETGNVVPTEDLRSALNRRQLWVATGDDDVPIGWAMSVPIDAGLHNEQLCVHPKHQRKGAGHALFDVRLTYATEAGFPRLTLSTFRDVPWNAPLYLKWGYRTLSEDELTPDLRRIRQAEFDRGLTGSPRVCMAYDLPR